MTGGYYVAERLNIKDNMLDIKFIRENSKKVKQACLNKQLDSQVVDRLLRVDSQRLEVLKRVEEIRTQINTNVEKIKQQVYAGEKPSAVLVTKGKQLKRQLKEQEPSLRELEAVWQQLLLQIPNVPSNDVPVGKDESANVVVRKEGQVRQFDFQPLSHDVLMEKLDLLDTKRAVKIGGFRSYFLKNDAVLLEQAILNFALELMVKHGFTPMTAPILVNRETMVGTGYFPWGAEDHYRVEEAGNNKKIKYLAGTSEVALTSFYVGETLREKDLPIKMVGISPCFRREVGSYGKDTKGIIRVHTFNKVEQVVYTVADEAETKIWHGKMLGFSEELLQKLGLPYQILLMCTGDMGAGQRKKYDIETWFPAQNKYRETHSASYFNDFQARRLNIRYQARDGSLKYVYTLNNTVAATPRLLAAIVENYQQKDGSLLVPEVLRKWVGKDKVRNRIKE